MKFIHTSDLHLGKRLGEFSLLDDQAYILNQLLGILQEEKPELLIISGDIYDKNIPPAQAVSLFDYFVTKVKELGIKIAIISGNHDNAERISFGNQLMKSSGVYICSDYNGNLESFKMSDEFGEVQIYLMPFLRPNSVKPFCETELLTYTSAIKECLDIAKIDYSKRNILLSHQFVTGALMSDSEDINVGGLDNVESYVYEKFDYVALGHIHKFQQIQDKNIYYSGTPLKYSFSEFLQKKGVIIGNIFNKGELEIAFKELTPIKDMKKIKGKFQDLIEQAFCEDYIHVILTDEEELLSPVNKLRVKYPHIMSLEYQNTRTNTKANQDYSTKNKDAYTLFAEFYKSQNGTDLSQVQQQYIKELTQMAN